MEEVEKLHNLYSSQNIIRQIKSRMSRWGCGTYWGEKSVQGFVGKPDRKRQLGRQA
jgi:hypothetical protein